MDEPEFVRDSEAREFRQIQRARVIDILEELKDLHGRLSRYYREAGSKVLDERAALLLHFLETHERYVRDAINEFEDGADSSFLLTWFRYANNIPVNQLAAHAHLGPDASSDDIAKVTAEISDYLIGACESIAEKTPIPEFQEALLNLRDVEKRAKIRVLRSADEQM